MRTSALALRVGRVERRRESLEHAQEHFPSGAREADGRGFSRRGWNQIHSAKSEAVSIDTLCAKARCRDSTRKSSNSLSLPFWRPEAQAGERDPSMNKKLVAQHVREWVWVGGIPSKRRTPSPAPAIRAHHRTSTNANNLRRNYSENHSEKGRDTRCEISVNC